MSNRSNVSILEVQGKQYLYLLVDYKQENKNKKYLYTIDKENGGINNASLPGIDLDADFNTQNTKQLHSNEFLIGAYYKIGKEGKQHLILCTANTQKQSSNSQIPKTIYLFNQSIYKIDQISFYDVSRNIVSTKPRPDLYFSPEFDLTLQFPYQKNETIGYNKVLDNNNKFCWNKELIRPFSKFYGNPCIIVLQGTVECVLDGEPEIIFISKFIQNNPYDLNLEHKEHSTGSDDEVKCKLELIIPALGKFQITSHSWYIVKTKNKDKKYFNEDKMEIIPINISNKFNDKDLINRYQKFKDERSKLFLFPFDLLYSSYGNDNNNQTQQKQIFYLIGDDNLHILNVSLLYIYCYIIDYYCYSCVNQTIFNAGTNSSKEIPIKKDLMNFFKKCMYRNGNIINNGSIISWQMNPEDSEPSYFQGIDDLCKFVKNTKSEKFILDLRHIKITYFKPNEESNQKLIKVKAHFQDDFIVNQILINLRHRDPSHIIKMSIMIDEDMSKNHLYCQQTLLPNPETEEIYTFDLHKIAKDSLLFPIDYFFFEKTRFVTIYFENEPEMSFNDFCEMIQESDIEFVVKRPVNKSPHFEVISSEENVKYRFCEFLDIFRNKNESSITNIRDFELTRIQNGISDYHRCMYLIMNNSNPNNFDFRSFIKRSFNSPNICSFCNQKLSRTNSFLYEASSICPLLISHTDSQSNKSFVICDQCNNKYITDSPLKPSKTNLITSSSIRPFVFQNKNHMTNINEFNDLNEIELPYQIDSEILISQNASVYRHSLNNYSIKEVQALFSPNSSTSIKFTNKMSILIYFQYEVQVKKITYSTKQNKSVSLSISTLQNKQRPTDDNPIIYSKEKIKCSSMKLTFMSKKRDSKQELTLENIKIFGYFLPPDPNSKNHRPAIDISKPLIQSSSIFEKKPKFDDNLKSVQTIMHNGIVKGYIIQVKKGQKLSSLVIAFYNRNDFIGHRCLLLPNKVNYKNDNRLFVIPDEFNDEHDSIKFYYLDREISDSVSIKIL